MTSFTTSSLRFGAPPGPPPGFAPRGSAPQSRLPLASLETRTRFFQRETQDYIETRNYVGIECFFFLDDASVAPEGYLSSSGKRIPVAGVFGVLPPACLLTANMHELSEDLNVPEPVIFAAIMRGFGEGFVSWLLGDRLPALLLTWPKPLLWHLVLQTLKYLASTDPESLWPELANYHNRTCEPSEKLRTCLLRVLDPEERSKRLAEVAAMLKEFKSRCGQLMLSRADLRKDTQMGDYFRDRCAELLDAYTAAAATAANPKKFALVSYFAAKTALTDAISKCRILEALLECRLSARALVKSWTAVSEGQVPLKLQQTLQEHVHAHLKNATALMSSGKLPADGREYTVATAVCRRIIAVVDYCQQVQLLEGCMQRTDCRTFPSVGRALGTQVANHWQKVIALLHDNTEIADIKLLSASLKTQIRGFN